LEVLLDGEKLTLQKRDRAVGSEAPALRVTMNNGEVKVIGMMADKVQVFVSVPYKNGLSDKMVEIINKHKEKSLIYVISSEALDDSLDVDISTDFKDFSLKMGLNINDTLCAKSVFIINKDGEFIYKEILDTLDGEFDTDAFDTALNEAIKFKKKGHTHENWMGV
jgi:thioredoxin-dependent peroxiredoxin